jgi:hypothetical protein
MERIANQPEQRPLGELFSELAQQTGTLVRDEVALARIEMTAKAKSAGRDAALVAGGGAIAMLGVMALMAALILVLAMAVPLWVSALIVGLVVSGVGLGIASAGIRAWRGLDPMPRRTIQTLQEDRQWLRAQASR